MPGQIEEGSCEKKGDEQAHDPYTVRQKQGKEQKKAYGEKQRQYEPLEGNKGCMSKQYTPCKGHKHGNEGAIEHFTLFPAKWRPLIV